MKEQKPKIGMMSKAGRKIVAEVLGNEDVTREQLEQLANRVVCDFNSPMDAVNEIAGKASLSSSQKLELRRVVIAKIREDKFSPGDEAIISSTGDRVTVISVMDVVITGKIVVTGKKKKDKEQEVYLTDLERAQ